MSNPTKQQSTMKKFIKWGAIALGALLLIGLIGSAIVPSKPKPQIVSKVVTHTVTVEAPAPAPRVITKTKTITVPGPTKTVVVHDQAPALAPAADSAPSGGQVLRGTGSQGLGTVHVTTDSTLTWDCGSRGGGNFIVNNDWNDDSMIGVNALDQTSGKTFIAPVTTTRSRSTPRAAPGP
jgi:hypothetical protein